jgi:hypothetical protein
MISHFLCGRTRIRVSGSVAGVVRAGGVGSGFCGLASMLDETWICRVLSPGVMVRGLSPGKRKMSMVYSCEELRSYGHGL